MKEPVFGSHPDGIQHLPLRNLYNGHGILEKFTCIVRAWRRKLKFQRANYISIFYHANAAVCKPVLISKLECPIGPWAILDSAF